jgi:HTH-type transcriptional regulator/antitoxin MqsA
MKERCQICGSDKIEVIIKDEEFKYKGYTLIISNYKSIACHTCGESIADKESYEKTIVLLRDFHRRTDGFLSSEEIKSIRKSFNMTQDEFSDLLGGGEKAFARYETGKVMQSKPMDNLLRILKEIPEAIDVLKEKTSTKHHLSVFKEDLGCYH